MFKIPLLERNESIIPVVYAKDAGFFKKYGLEVSLKFHKNIWEDRLGFIEEEYKFVRGDFTRYLEFKNSGIDVVISHDFTRDFKLVSKVAVEKLEELNGKKVLISKGTSIEFYLDLFLKDNDLKVEKINIKEIVNRYEEFLENKDIELIMLPDPFAKKLLDNGCYLIHDITTTNINIKGYIWHTQYYLDNQDFVNKYFEAVNEATLKFNSLKDEEQIVYLKKYDMIDSEEKYAHRNYEISRPFSKTSYDLAEKWFNENRKNNS